eukprot:533018_1
MKCFFLIEPSLFSLEAMHTTTVKHTIDVSNSCDTEETTHYSFNVENMTMDFEFHPKGNKNAKERYNSCFVRIIPYNDKTCSVDDRVVTVKFKIINVKKFELGDRKVQEYLESGWGYNSFVTQQQLKSAQNKIQMEVSIVTDEYRFSHELPSMHIKQLKSLYEMSKQTGDILLITNKAKKCNIADDTKEEFENREEVESLNEGIRISGTVLMSSSEVFQKMLENNMKEAKKKQVIIHCECIEVIDDMVYFITTGGLRIDSDTLKLLELSHCYQLKLLNYACLDRLINKLNSDSLISTINGFEKYALKDEHGTKIYCKLIRKFQNNKKDLVNAQNSKEMPFYWIAWSRAMK